MGGWSRSGPLGLRLDCSGEEMAEISRGWLMLFTCWEKGHVDYTQMLCWETKLTWHHKMCLYDTKILLNCPLKISLIYQSMFSPCFLWLTMELMLSGDPEEWLLELSPGNDLLFGDPLAVTAVAELRFLLPRLRPSCEPRLWEECIDDVCVGGWVCCVPGDWWWWFPWLLWYPCLAELPVWWWRRAPPTMLPPLPDEEEDEDEEEEGEKKILLRSSLSCGSMSESPPWWSCPSSGRILGGPSAYWSTPPVLSGGLWMELPRPIGPVRRVLLCWGGDEEAPLWSSGWGPPLISPEYPKQRPNSSRLGMYKRDWDIRARYHTYNNILLIPPQLQESWVPL